MSQPPEANIGDSGDELAAGTRDPAPLPLNIFINYRRRDASGHARALFDRLVEHFGADSVFLDVVTLQPGTKWLNEIRTDSSTCGAMIVLIGPSWASMLRERAAGADEDHVSSEIEAALRRGSRVHVIPTLVGDAVTPAEREIPPPLRRLLLRQQTELRPTHWEADVDHLIDVLERFARQPPQTDLPPEPTTRQMQRPPTEERASAPRPDDSHYDELVRLLLEDGTVVPFLGPGTNSSDRDTPWRDVDCGSLPDSDELAGYLADKLQLSAESGDLAHISQHMAVARGTGDLYRALRRTLVQRCPPSAVHKFLAEFPSRLSELALADRCQLIVTTNYDDALERAFEAAEEPYDLAVYMASGEDRGKFVHVPFDGEPTPVNVANGYRDFPINAWGELERTVIVKIHGTVDEASGPYAWRDNYVITEDDYIDYLSHRPVVQVVPQQILAKLRDSHFLFLGYTMRDWNLRVFLHRVFGQQLPNSSWAIQRNSSVLDGRFWRKVGVDLFQLPLIDYVAELGRHVADQREVQLGT